MYNQLSGLVSNKTNDYIFIKTEYRIEKIEIKDILYIQGMKDYLQVHTIDRKNYDFANIQEFIRNIASD